MPFANLNVLKRNLEFFKEHGVIGLFEEGAPNTALSYAGELRQYVLAKLMFDLGLDDKLLMDEFYFGVFGSAASYVKAYYEFWQEKSHAYGEHLKEVLRLSALRVITQKLFGTKHPRETGN